MTAETITCPRDAAFKAVADHVKQCKPCGRIWAGIGRDCYTYCDEYRRLEAAHNAAPCTCPHNED